MTEYKMIRIPENVYNKIKQRQRKKKIGRGKESIAVTLSRIIQQSTQRK